MAQAGQHGGWSGAVNNHLRTSYLLNPSYESTRLLAGHPVKGSVRRGRAEAGLVAARDQQPEASSRASGSGSQQRLEQVQPDVNAAAHFAANARSLSLCSSRASVHRYEELDKAASP